MALQSATTATTASNAAGIDAREVLGSLTITDIDSKITAASTKTNTDERIYKITVALDADINGRTDPIEIIQSDSSRIFIRDLEGALIDAGYRVSYKALKTRDGKNDKVKLQIAWG